MKPPETHYAVGAGDASIAYQVWGSGPLDLVVGRPSETPVDLLWEEPRVVQMLERLGSFSRNIWIDGRGWGSSGEFAPDITLGADSWLEDFRTVQDAVGSERAVMMTFGEGVPSAVLLAAAFPQRVSALILVNGCARFCRADDYPWGLPAESKEQWLEAVRAMWGRPAILEVLAPSMVNDERWCRWWLRCQRLAVAPEVVAKYGRTILETNVHHILSAIQVPTLVLHRRGDRHIPVEHGRFLGEHIPGAIYRELEGNDHAFCAGDSDALVDEIEEFVTGVRPVAPTERVLATVLFTDIVGSSQQASSLGDRNWRTLLDAHDAVVRTQLDRFRGREVKSTGDGFLATFDGPARAIRCAIELTAALRPLDIEIRSGLHTGEVEVRGDDVGGIGVHIAARVLGQAQPGEVLVSRTVTDLVAGSGIDFDDRGEHQLRGVSGAWHLFAVR